MVEVVAFRSNGRNEEAASRQKSAAEGRVRADSSS